MVGSVRSFQLLNTMVPSSARSTSAVVGMLYALAISWTLSAPLTVTIAWVRACVHARFMNSCVKVSKHSASDFARTSGGLSAPPNPFPLNEPIVR